MRHPLGYFGNSIRLYSLTIFSQGQWINFFQKRTQYFFRKCNWILILNLAVWKRKILKPPSEILTKIDCKCANFKHILYLIWKTFDIFNYCRCKIYLWCSKAFFMFLIFIFGDILGIQFAAPRRLTQQNPFFLPLVYYDTFPFIYFLKTCLWLPLEI